MRARISSTAGSPLRRVSRALPRGGSLPDAEWERRHLWIVRLLWAHVVVLAAWGAALGYGPGHEALHVLALLPFVGIAAARRGSRRLRAAAASIGAFAASAVVVHLADGVTEAHFHFFVLVVVLALYEDWLPFGLGVAFVLLHHAVLGLVDPGAVFVRVDHFRDPVLWAAVHGLYVSAAGIAAVLAWRFNERIRDRLGEAQERFRRAFGEAPVGMALVAPDGRILQANPALARVLGYQAAELLSRNFHDLHHPDDLATAVDLKDRLLAGEIQSYTQDKRYLHSSGATVWVSVSVSLVRDRDGEPLYLVGQVEDVTERRRAEDQLRRQQEDLLAVTEVIRDIATRRDGRQSVCDAACRLTGATVAALVEPEGEMLRVTASAGGELDGVEITLGREPSGAGVAFVTRRPYFVSDAPNCADVSPRLVAAAGAESLLFHPVERDDACVGVLVVGWDHRVDGLGSREAGLAGLLAGEAALALEHAALLQRIEDIVVINDTEGHAGGDAFLVDAARAWAERVRVADVLARLGGDEFGIVLPSCSLDEAALLAQRLGRAVPGGRSCSIGIAELAPAEDAATLVQRADAALYRAKASGRGRVHTVPA